MGIVVKVNEKGGDEVKVVGYIVRITVLETKKYFIERFVLFIMMKSIVCLECFANSQYSSLFTGMYAVYIQN